MPDYGDLLDLLNSDFQPGWPLRLFKDQSWSVFKISKIDMLGDDDFL